MNIEKSANEQRPRRRDNCELNEKLCSRTGLFIDSFHIFTSARSRFGALSLDENGHVGDVSQIGRNFFLFCLLYRNYYFIYSLLFSDRFIIDIVEIVGQIDL